MRKRQPRRGLMLEQLESRQMLSADFAGRFYSRAADRGGDDLSHQRFQTRHASQFRTPHSERISKSIDTSISSKPILFVSINSSASTPPINDSKNAALAKPTNTSARAPAPRPASTTTIITSTIVLIPRSSLTANSPRLPSVTPASASTEPPVESSAQSSNAVAPSNVQFSNYQAAAVHEANPLTNVTEYYNAPGGMIDSGKYPQPANNALPRPWLDSPPDISWEVETDSLRRTRELSDKALDSCLDARLPSSELRLPAPPNDVAKHDAAVDHWFGSQTGFIEITSQGTLPCLPIDSNAIIQVTLDAAVGLHRSFELLTLTESFSSPDSVRDAILEALAAEQYPSEPLAKTQPKQTRTYALATGMLVAGTVGLAKRRSAKIKMMKSLATKPFTGHA